MNRLHILVCVWGGGGLTFAITLSEIPYKEIIFGVEAALQEIWGEVVCFLKRVDLPKSNPSWQEKAAL